MKDLTGSKWNMAGSILKGNNPSEDTPIFDLIP